MAPAAPSEKEPRPVAGPVAFEEGDFHALSEGLCRNPDYNDRRLLARRKLLALGKRAVARIKTEEGTALDSRTSLHNPNTFNGMRVRRLWAYLTRAKAEKRKLRSILGAELAKDLDSAYRNAYLCVALEAEALEVSLRIHPDAWYDGQNLKNRCEREGVQAWLGLLNELPGYFLRLHDWKGEWRCGELTGGRLEEFLGSWTPGEHALAVERRWPAPAGNRGAVLDEGVPEAVIDELARLVPLYRFCAWSDESSFLFSSD
ncbi:MAG: hypothetical protein AAF682_29800 [Planctomycetota bacterium]